MRHILKCSKCGKYTMKDVCECDGKAVNPMPAKYSPVDSYAKYRRKAKLKERQEEGLL